MQYFITIEGAQKGPFSKDELKANGMNANTLVWYEGAKDWKKANEIEDLKDLIATIPPPVPMVDKNKISEKSYNVWVILLCVLLVIATFGWALPFVIIYLLGRKYGAYKMYSILSLIIALLLTALSTSFVVIINTEPKYDFLGEEFSILGSILIGFGVYFLAYSIASLSREIKKK
jgi:hypothetical protein